MTLLAENLTPDKNTRDLSFPSVTEREKGTILEAARTNLRSIDSDTYLIIASPMKLQNSRILSQRDRIVDDGSSYAADVLLNLLNNNTIATYGATTLLIE